VNPVQNPPSKEEIAVIARNRRDRRDRKGNFHHGGTETRRKPLRAEEEIGVIGNLKPNIPPPISLI